MQQLKKQKSSSDSDLSYDATDLEDATELAVCLRSLAPEILTELAGAHQQVPTAKQGVTAYNLSELAINKLDSGYAIHEQG